MTVEAKKRSRRGRKGQVFVESALTLLAFMCLVVGVLDCGQFLFLHQTIGEKVRNAARAVSFEGLNTNAARLEVNVSNLRYPVFSPLMAGAFTNIPVRFSAPLERP